MKRLVFVLAIFSCVTLGGCDSTQTETRPRSDGPGTSTSRYALTAAQSCEDVRARVTAASAEEVLRWRYGYGMRGGVVEDMADGAGAPEPAADPSSDGDFNSGEESGGGGSSSPTDVTGTNVQEEGVDENDRIKTDGEYIYTVRGQDLIILDSWPAATTSVASTFRLGDEESAYNGDSLFLNGDRVVVFSQYWGYGGGVGDGGVIVDAPAEDRPDSDSDSDGADAGTPDVPGEEPPDAEGGGSGESSGSDESSDENHTDESTPPDGDSVDDEPDDKLEYFSGVRISIVDVTDRTAPRLVEQMDIEGSLASARMVGNDIYLVSNSGMRNPVDLWDLVWGETAEDLPPVPDWDASEEEFLAAMAQARPMVLNLVEEMFVDVAVEDLLPRKMVFASPDDEGTIESLYACTDIYMPQDVAQLGMLNVTHVQLGGLDSVHTTGLLASGWQVYASQQSLYVAMSSGAWWWGWDIAENVSHLHKFDLVGGGAHPRYVASGKVDGWILNQFSMSEYGGHLRVATTDNQWIWDETTGESDLQGGNHLTIVREDAGELVETGAVRNLAPGEQIYSVRMMGPKGFVVTFRQTDPLFTLDLSNPANPQLLGELHINGFSSYIHPLGDTHLLTIGQDADDDGRVLGVHLQIFDVSDMTNPQRAHQEVLSYGNWSSYSEALWDHHAFTFHAEKGVVAFPLTIQEWSEFGSQNFSGLMIYEVSADTGFDRLGGINHADLAVDAWCRGENSDWCEEEAQWWASVSRSVFIEDYVYSLSPYGIKVNMLMTPETEVGSVLFE